MRNATRSSRSSDAFPFGLKGKTPLRIQSAARVCSPDTQPMSKASFLFGWREAPVEHAGLGPINFLVANQPEEIFGILPEAEVAVELLPSSAIHIVLKHMEISPIPEAKRAKSDCLSRAVGRGCSVARH